LSQAVHDQMVADVPIGAFLSGGIDSTVIVALMQDQSARTVRTFSIGSTEQEYDEARYASAISRHLGTDHTELYVSPAEALAVVPELARIYDEPFADSSQIPMVLLARLARQHVTVALSGDAGDEVFGGYNRYSFAPRVWASLGRFPVGMRSLLAAGIRALPPELWDRLGGMVARMGRREGIRLLGEKMHKLARAVPAADHVDVYRRLASCWLVPPVAARVSKKFPRWYTVPDSLYAADNFIEYMMLLDFVSYMADDILVKVDRATMSAGLESRIPMLDHRLVEFMGRVPVSHKLAGGVSKRILRDIAYARVPRELIERPKTGFGVPIDRWLRGPLKDWAESLLSVSSLKRHGLLDVSVVRSVWSQYLHGRSPRHHELWAVLMFQAWMEEHHGVP
jgi:asparagine synthase (glutamine-hydrolysing)